MTPFHRFRIVPAILLLIVCLTLPVAAFTVSSVTVDPPGNQAPGTPMTVRSVIDFPRTGSNVTFPAANELQMSTDLTSPYWVPVLVLDGKEIRLEIKSGGETTVTGYYLSYPAYQDVQLMVTVTGNVPDNPVPSQNLLKIEETDADKNTVSTAHVAMPEAPFMTIATQSPTKKPTVKKTFTPIATATTPTQASPAGTGAAVIAVAGAVLLGMKRK
jgi:hypothetical protein